MRFVSLFLASFALFSGSVAACSSGDPVLSDDDEDDDAGGTKRPDATTTRPGSSSSSGGSSSGGKGSSSGGSSSSSGGSVGTLCEDELALYQECGFDDGITCGVDGYVANCRANNDATESAQRLEGRAACLGAANCDPADRKDCIYRTYENAELTAAQSQLLDHYCQTCEAADVEACKQRTLHYDPAAGIESTDTIFLAAWELAPALVDQIDAECIDAAASGDAGTCAERFDDCAAGPYIDALVDCE